jgi:hypothetical protein
MRVEKILKSMTKNALVVLALRLGIENPSTFSKDDLVTHLLKNIPEETLIESLTPGGKNKRKLSITRIGTYASIIGVILAIVFFYVSKKGDETVDKRIIDVEKKLDNYTRLKGEQIIKKKDMKIFDKKPSVTKNNSLEDNLQTQNSNVKTYDVILVIPSDMSDAEIFVDGKPANIIKRTPTIIKIRVKAKATGVNHQFSVKKGNQSCTQKLVISESNLRVPICQ